MVRKQKMYVFGGGQGQRMSCLSGFLGQQFGDGSGGNMKLETPEVALQGTRPTPDGMCQTLLFVLCVLMCVGVRSSLLLFLELLLLFLI